MKGIKKTIGTSISILLLLIFSVTVLPLDALHNHAEVKVHCAGSTDVQKCHKNHISTKSAFCWVCAIHFDKTYTGKPSLEKLADLPAISLFAENHITGFFVEQIFSALRGPPSR
ncbi:MAG: hypothetical protein ABI390_08615 [Daejeonella sp.]